MAWGKEWLEKADIIGKLLIPVVLAGVGFLISKTLNDIQSRESNTRVYTELMTKREDADTSLRRSMFESVLKTFLETRPGNADRDLVNLELLAYNFHETLNLKSLFQHVERQILLGPPQQSRELEERLIRLARHVSEQQLRVLEESGAVARFDFDLDDKTTWSPPEGRVSVEDHKTWTPLDGKAALAQFAPRPGATAERSYSLQLQKVDQAGKSLRLWLQIFAPGADRGAREVTSTFDAGYFDFPMVENLRLSHGQRCAVVVTEVSELVARCSVAFFPGSRASLKEKPYYDEILDELLHTQKELKAHVQ